MEAMTCTVCNGDCQLTEVRAVFGHGGSGPWPEDDTADCQHCGGTGDEPCAYCREAPAVGELDPRTYACQGCLANSEPEGE